MEMELYKPGQANLPLNQREEITENTPADKIIAWTLERFVDQRLALTSSFGMEGCALIDMYASHGVPFTVYYLDTMLFFKETYDLRDTLIERYPHVNFVNRGTAVTIEEQQKEHGAELWKRDPAKCCQIRKVDPMYAVMGNIDVWIAALRRSQSAARANLRVIDWDWRYQVLKISPLATWERADVWDYIKKNDVPYNALHEQGYPTVGCTHCTKAVPGSSVGEYSRAGRWSTAEKTECGLHGGEGI